MKPSSRLIPSRTNILVLLGAQALALALIAIGAQLDGPARWALAIAFSFLLLTNYALLHEAAHGLLHADARQNRWLGTLCGALFPVSFSLYQAAHLAHHRSNKTDLEMFDYYYPDDRKWFKFVVWYAILIGLHWVVLPLGTVAIAIFPKLLRFAPFSHMASTPLLARVFEQRELVRRMRRELLALAAYWTLAWVMLPLDAATLALYYACFAFNWSTRQYLTHAFAPRDVVNGAHNLRVSRPMQWILLNGHLDLVHHQHPALPWTELHRAAGNSRAPVSALRLYLRMWAGPRPNREPAPLPLSRL